ASTGPRVYRETNRSGIKLATRCGWSPTHPRSGATLKDAPGARILIVFIPLSIKINLYAPVSISNFTCGMAKPKPRNISKALDPTGTDSQHSGEQPAKRPRGRPRRVLAALDSTKPGDAAAGGHRVESVDNTPDLNAKVKELLRLARDQGHLTYDDVNDAL